MKQRFKDFVKESVESRYQEFMNYSKEFLKDLLKTKEEQVKELEEKSAKKDYSGYKGPRFLLGDLQRTKEDVTALKQALARKIAGKEIK